MINNQYIVKEAGYECSGGKWRSAKGDEEGGRPKKKKKCSREHTQANM